MALRAGLIAALLAGVACSDGDGATGGVDAGADTTDGATGAGSDGGTAGDDGGAAADGGADSDGSTAGDDGGTPGADGGEDDGGNPLEDPLSEFCDGMGTVVVVGAGGECAGEIAEETFRFAVCTCDALTIGSRLTVDAFDSRLGPYASTSTSGRNVSDDGHLGANRGVDTAGKVEVMGSIYTASGGFRAGSDNSVSQNLYVIGDAVQPNSRMDVGRNAFVSGDVTGRFEIAGDLTVPNASTVSAATVVTGAVVRRNIPPAPVCKCEQADLLDVAGIAAWGRDHNDNLATGVVTSTTYSTGNGPSELRLPCGRYYLEGVAHGGGLRIVAEDRTVLFVDGDFRVDGPLEIDVEPGAEVDVFIAGHLEVGASVRFGEPSAPSAVRTYVGGSGLIDLQASAGFGGNLYAPRAHVAFGASARLYGAVFTSTLTLSGATEVHYDTALRSAGDPCDDTDAGVDGGVEEDGGEGTDGGLPEDGGPTPDAGTPADDAGPGPADGGEPGCTSCAECAVPSGCVIPPAETSGQCGPCQADIDCCPPYVCQGGACIINL